MAGVFFGEVFPREDVAEVGSAVAALDFCADAVGVRKPPNRAWNLLVEAWPTTIRLKLTFRTIQRRTATLTHVGALLPERKVFPSERRLRALTLDDTLLLSRKRRTLTLRIRQNKNTK